MNAISHEEEKMITSKEFVSRWTRSTLSNYHPGELITYAEPFVASLNIPDDSKAFLIHAGLPCQKSSPYVFNIAPNRLPPLAEVSFPFQIPVDYERLRLLGKFEYDTPTGQGLRALICLDETQRGQVVMLQNANSLRLSGHDNPSLVKNLYNTSVVHMAEIMLIYEEFCRWCIEFRAESGDLKNYEKQCQLVVNHMRDVDPQALANGSHWSSTIAEIEDSCVTSNE